MKKGVLIAIICVALVLLFSIILYIIYSNNKIKVDYYTENNELLSSLKVSKGSHLKLPELTKDGYVFMGWYNGNTKIDENYSVTEPISLIPKWTAATFNVTFFSDENIFYANKTISCDGYLTLPEDPVKVGSKFNSWKDKNGVSYSEGQKLACQDLSLYASWD